jgi:hypothetical protein
MIEDFTRVLAHVMGLKNMNKNSEALDEIYDAYKTFFGLNQEELGKILPEDFVKKISENPDFKKEHLESIARALMMEGDLYPLNPVKSQDCREKALLLFRHLEIIDAGTFSLTRKESIKQLENLLLSE